MTRGAGQGRGKVEGKGGARKSARFFSYRLAAKRQDISAALRQGDKRILLHENYVNISQRFIAFQK
jgi:hypothetical protein